ncbi:hypothetical protein [Halomonas shantousis]
MSAKKPPAGGLIDHSKMENADNCCARPFGVEIRLKMLIYSRKLRFFGEFRLDWPSLVTFVSIPMRF